MTVAIKTKDGLYLDWFSMDMFSLLIVKVFGCLQQQVDKFFHQCTNVASGTNGIKGCAFLILCAFYREKV
jgi:hypothetical protein